MIWAILFSTIYICVFVCFHNITQQLLVNDVPVKIPRTSIPDSPVSWKLPQNKIYQCDIKTLIRCNPQEKSSCTACTNKAQCVSLKEDVVFTMNNEQKTIPMNTGPDDGYCLNEGINAKKIKCSPKLGGVLRLYVSVLPDKTTSYQYKCECTIPCLINKDSTFSDCSNFVGCLNNSGPVTIGPDFNINTFRCPCNGGFKHQMVNNIPTCVPNTWRDMLLRPLPFPIKYLELKHIDKKILRQYTPEEQTRLHIPNPCYVKNGNKYKFYDPIPVQNAPDIIACPEPTDISVVLNNTLAHIHIVLSTIWTSSCLRNNDGKFPNGYILVDEQKEVSDQLAPRLFRKPCEDIIMYDDDHFIPVAALYINGNWAYGGRARITFIQPLPSFHPLIDMLMLENMRSKEISSDDTWDWK